MRIIAITTPKVDDNDIPLIKGLIGCGIDIIHLRKPVSDIQGCRMILRELTPQERSKVIVHDYPELYYEFSLKGIHINKNVVTFPEEYSGFRTRSCHTIEEVVKYKSEYDYIFLSPIFDSISKSEYKSGFCHRELEQAAKDGIIDGKVVALGGVTFDSIPYLQSLNFGGAAMLGFLYHPCVLERLTSDF